MPKGDKSILREKSEAQMLEETQRTRVHAALQKKGLGGTIKKKREKLRVRVNPISLSYPLTLVLRVHVRVRAIPILVLIER